MPPDPDLRAISETLNRIDQYGALGRVSLAQGRAVQAEIARVGLADTSFQRGRILSRLIRREVQTRFKRCSEGTAARDVAEWTILYLRLHEGLSLQQIATRLHMPLRSVARYYARAKALLLDWIYELDEGHGAGGFYCPLCGTHLHLVRAHLPATGTCSGCGAALTVDEEGSAAVRIVAHPAERLDVSKPAR